MYTFQVGVGPWGAFTFSYAGRLTACAWLFISNAQDSLWSRYTPINTLTVLEFCGNLAFPFCTQPMQSLRNCASHASYFMLTTYTRTLFCIVVCLEHHGPTLLLNRKHTK